MGEKVAIARMHLSKASCEFQITTYTKGLEFVYVRILKRYALNMQFLLRRSQVKVNKAAKA